MKHDHLSMSVSYKCKKNMTKVSWSPKHMELAVDSKKKNDDQHFLGSHQGRRLHNTYKWM